MARRSSVVPLKKRTPRWFCINIPYGTIHNLVTYPKTLYYVVDPREMKNMKKMLGNPHFFDQYDYLLVTKDAIGDFEEVFGVISPLADSGEKDLAAFTGEVERISFGWAQDKRHYDAIMKGESHEMCVGGNCDDEDEM